MRNLLAFFLRYSGFLVFVVLELISFILIIRHNNDQNVIFFSSANYFSGKLYEKRSEWLSYFRLDDINDSLSIENARLRAALLQAKQKPLPPEDTAYLETDSTRIPYRFIPAKVINNSLDQYNNYLTLDRGSRHGIRENMGVLGFPGIVGIVKHVSANYAQAMSLLHHQCRISAIIKRNGYLGYISWPGNDRNTLLLNGIPKHVPVTVGDSIMTSGYSAIFPPGILIGTISFIDAGEEDKGSNFYKIKVKPSNNLQNIHFVYVVDHAMKEEKIMLEQAEANAK